MNVDDLNLSQNVGGNGGYLDVNNAGGDIVLNVNDVAAHQNAQHGFHVTANAGGAAGSIDAQFNDIATGNNTFSGFNVGFTAAGNADLLVENSQFFNNAVDGAIVTVAAAGTASMDFGGGALAGAGLNSIYGNTGIGLNNAGAGTIDANNNFWSGAAPVAGADYSAAGVNVPATWLATDPN